ncbi:MAG: hypothetical protein ACW99U_13190 [Candidatus Thorarchaeota archaeon]|jgi:hypothetical protein
MRMMQSNAPSIDDIITLVAELVPDIPEPSEIMAEIKSGDRILWLEGWCDGCIADRRFPPKGEGMLQEKLDYIGELTPGFLEKRAKSRGKVLLWSGFVPLDGKDHLYGVSWGVFGKAV